MLILVHFILICLMVYSICEFSTNSEEVAEHTPLTT